MANSDFQAVAAIYEGVLVLLAAGSLICFVLAWRAFRARRPRRALWLALAPFLALAGCGLLLFGLHRIF